MDAIFGCFGGDLKKEMNIDPGEILRRLGGCRKRCGLDVLRGLLKVGWDVEKFRAWPIVSMAYCKCICKKTISLCSSNSKYGELVRVLSNKCEVLSSSPIANRGDSVRLP